jgi:hypothetical protein
MDFLDYDFKSNGIFNKNMTNLKNLLSDHDWLTISGVVCLCMLGISIFIDLADYYIKKVEYYTQKDARPE